MRRPHCEHEKPEAVKFLRCCGTKIEGLRPRCGAANPPANAFRHSCGQRLGPGTASLDIAKLVSPSR